MRARCPMFYASATPLSPSRHRGCYVAAGTDYGFSRSANCVPLLAMEFPAAASEYVIAFTGTSDAVTPVVVLGLAARENWYLDDRNAWQAAYVPAYVRRYPFLLASANAEAPAPCVDESFAGFNRQGRGQPLFDAEGKPAPFLESVVALLRDYQAHERRTQAFCATLKRSGILQPIRVDVKSATGEGVRLEGVMAVSRERLRALPGDVLASLVSTDALELIYLHLRSLDNIGALQGRLSSRASGGGASRSYSMACPYDLDFVFRECGFDWVPEDIDRNLLFNVSYDLKTREMKLYVLAPGRDFIYKIGANTITKQYDAVTHGADPARLSEFLGADLDYQDLLLDTVEDDVYYLFVEDSSAAQCV